MVRKKTEKDRTMQILQFTRLDQVAPVYFDKTYHAEPEPGGEKAFELLRRAMMDERKIAIARSILGTKDTLLALIPRDEGIIIQTMFFEAEVKEMPKATAKQLVNEAELTMAKTLISSMDKPFDPAQYHDEYQTRLRELISRKIAGKEVVTSPAEEQGNVIDLMGVVTRNGI